MKTRRGAEQYRRKKRDSRKCCPPFVVLEHRSIMTPQLLSQENYTKKFSKSQKVGFYIDFLCCPRYGNHGAFRMVAGGGNLPLYITRCFQGLPLHPLRSSPICSNPALWVFARLGLACGGEYNRPLFPQSLQVCPRIGGSWHSKAHQRRLGVPCAPPRK